MDQLDSPFLQGTKKAPEGAFLLLAVSIRDPDASTHADDARPLPETEQ